jgi:4-hydroxybenzoyl-CoA thioesterase
MGDVLSAELTVRAVGGSSVTLGIEFRGPDGENRVRATLVLVLVDAETKRPMPIPEDVRARMEL